MRELGLESRWDHNIFFSKSFYWRFHEQLFQKEGFKTEDFLFLGARYLLPTYTKRKVFLWIKPFSFHVQGVDTFLQSWFRRDERQSILRIILRGIFESIQEKWQFERFHQQHCDACFFHAHFYIDLGSLLPKHVDLSDDELWELFSHLLLIFEREIRVHEDVFSFWVLRAYIQEF